METLPKIVLCIPGQWPGIDALGNAVLATNESLIFSGSLLLDAATGRTAEIELSERDPNLRRAFELSAYTPFEPDFLDAVDTHQLVLYLIGQGGSPDAGRALMEMASGVLRAGGTGVKVESSAVSHSAEGWLDLAAQKPVLALYEAYVTFVRGRDHYFSCGMHNLGLRDAMVDIAVPPPEAWRLLQAFQQYLLLEDPALEDGQLFRQTPDSPTFRLHREACTLYPADDLLYNPYGMWRLEKV